MDSLLTSNSMEKGAEGKREREREIRAKTATVASKSSTKKQILVRRDETKA